MPLVIAPDLNHSILVLGTVVFGTILYALRCRHLFWYGVIEIVTSLVVIYVAWVPQKSTVLLNSGTSQLAPDLLTGIGVVTGMYILIRGLDNVFRDLPVRWRPSWKRVFYGRE
jgi:hypothetical protein